MDEVIVTASRTEQPYRKIGGSVSVIDREQIETMQADNPGGLLRHVPGVSVTRGGNGSGQKVDVRIRGSETNHTLVLLDGIELNAGDDGYYDLANIPTEIIQRIEVLRGAQSVLYGSESIGGVINIITRKPQGETENHVRAEAGSFNSQAVQGQHAGQHEGFQYRFFYRHEESEGFSQCNENRGCTEKDGHEQNHYQGTVTRQLTEALKLTSMFRFTEAELETDSVFGGVTDNSDESRDIERSGKFELDYDPGKGGWQHTLRGTFDNVDNYFNQSRNGAHEKQKLQYQTHVPLSDRYRLTAGVSLEEDEITDSDDHREDNAVFGELQADVSDNWFLTMGVRHDEFDAEGFSQQTPDETTGRLTTAMFPFGASSLKVRGSWGSAIVRPGLFDLQGGFGIPGNPDLEAEKSEQWELGVDYSPPGTGDRVSLTYFDNEIEDKILAGSFGTAAQNANRVTAEGVEFSFRWSPVSYLVTDGSFTYMSSKEITSTGQRQDLLRRPDSLGSLSTTYRGNDWTTTGEVIYNGENTQQNFTKLGSPREEISGYTLVNILAEYDISDQTTLRGRVENVFDREYEEVFGFGTAGLSGRVSLSARF